MSKQERVSHSVRVQIADIIVEQLAVTRDEVVPGARIVEDLGADSLERVWLVMAMEEEFGVDIYDEDAEQVRTVADVCELLERLLFPGPRALDAVSPGAVAPAPDGPRGHSPSPPREGTTVIPLTDELFLVTGTNSSLPAALVIVPLVGDGAYSVELQATTLYPDVLLQIAEHQGTGVVVGEDDDAQP